MNQGVGCLGMRQGKIDGNAATRGQAQDAGMRDIKIRQQGLRVVGVLIGLTRGECGLAKATRVITDHLILVGQGLELVIPHPGIQRHPVHEDQGLASPATS